MKKDVVIEYPLQLGELNILKSLVLSSKNKFTVGVSFRTNIYRWRPDRVTGSKIRNKTSTTCGRSTPSRRTVELTITFPSDRGALLPRGVGWDNLNTKELAVLAPKSIKKSLQFIGVTSGTEINSTAIIRMCLHISLPESGTRRIDEGLDASNNLRLIEQSDVMVKISPQYGYNDDASFLLITNPATPTNLIEEMKNIIEDDLKSGQHGGFEYPPESSEEEPKTVISSYAGKSIMFLGNDFDYFGQGPQNALQLCNIEVIAQSSIMKELQVSFWNMQTRNIIVFWSPLFSQSIIAYRIHRPSSRTLPILQRGRNFYKQLANRRQLAVHNSQHTLCL